MAVIDSPSFANPWVIDAENAEVNFSVIESEKFWSKLFTDSVTSTLLLILSDTMLSSDMMADMIRDLTNEESLYNALK